MEYRVRILCDRLSKLGASSKEYVGDKTKTPNIRRFAERVWQAQSNKTKARDVLPPSPLSEEFDNEFRYLVDNKLVLKTEIEDGEYKEDHLFLLPMGMELQTMLQEIPEATLSQAQLDEMLARARDGFLTEMVDMMKTKVQKPLVETDKMSAKLAIFCCLLLLNGSMSYDKALRLTQKEESKEFELQDVVVEHLNAIAKSLYPKSAGFKNNKMLYSNGELWNVIRRVKAVRVAFGEIFVNHENSFYFQVEDTQGKVKLDSLRWVIKVILKRLKHFEDTGDHVAALLDLITRYRLENPIDQAHQNILFGKNVSDDYYPLLRYLVDEEFRKN